MIRIKRVYEPVGKTDGFLVERLWPRGIKKAALHMTGRPKKATPSKGLREWFSHDPAKRKGFQRRYRAELKNHAGACQPFLDAARKGDVTLLFSAHDLEHNNTVVLRVCLEKQLKAESKG